MPTITAELSNISAADANKNRTATFSPGNGNPAWSGVQNGGEIDANGPGAAAADVVFNLTSGSPVSFSSSGPFTATPASTEFSVTSNTGSSITVHDNNDVGSGTYEYTLHFSDGTRLDPRFINR